MASLAYLESGLVPPVNDRPWFPPHVPPVTKPDETVPPCDFPREARRKFRKEWRRAVAAMEKSGSINRKTARKYRERREDGTPSQSARSSRRVIVMDAMIHRGEAMLEEREQRAASAVQSSNTDDSATS